MIKIISIIILFTLLSCTSHTPNTEILAKGKIKEEKFVLKNPVNIVIKPGEARLLKIPFPKTYIIKKLVCGKRTFLVSHSKGQLKAFLAVPLKTRLKPINCYLTFNGIDGVEDALVAKLKVVSKSFDSETLKVPKKTIDLSKKDLARYFKEKKIIKKAYANPNRSPLFNRPFIQPLNTFITSNFGKKRIYNNKKESQHGGVDFRAKMNTPIPVSNSGKVVLAMDLFFTGNTVLVDHGMGIFTMYAHLNKIIAQVGEYLPQGAIVGLSGMTGRVSGPHLHWGVKISGVNIDGLNFLKAGI